MVHYRRNKAYRLLKLEGFLKFNAQRPLALMTKTSLEVRYLSRIYNYHLKKDRAQRMTCCFIVRLFRVVTILAL